MPSDLLRFCQQLFDRAEEGEPVLYSIPSSLFLLRSEDPIAFARVGRFFPPSRQEAGDTVHTVFSISQLDDPDDFETLERETVHCERMWRQEIFPGEYATAYSLAESPSPLQLYRVGTDMASRYWILYQGAGSSRDRLLLLASPTYAGRSHVLLRVLRELFYRVREREGAVFFHAGAIAFQGKGLLLVGPHGAGKTTLICHLLSQQDATYLGNDHSWIQRCGHWQVGGFPLVLRLGEGTLQAWESLQENAHPATPTTIQQKWEMAPEDFVRGLGCGWRMATELHAIIFPTLTPTGPALPVIEEISSSLGKQLLLNESYTPFDPRWKPWIIPRLIDDASLSRLVEHRLSHLVQTLPLLRLHFSYASTQDAIVRCCQVALEKERGL